MKGPWDEFDRKAPKVKALGRRLAALLVKAEPIDQLGLLSSMLDEFNKRAGWHVTTDGQEVALRHKSGWRGSIITWYDVELKERKERASGFAWTGHVDNPLPPPLKPPASRKGK